MNLIAFKITDQQLAALDRAAKQAHNTRSGILRLALDRYLGTGTQPVALPKHAATCRCAACRAA